MSGVDYSSPIVTKTDLQRVEQRIQTNTVLTQIPLASAANVLYYDATTRAVSYNTAPGGGGGGAPICLTANQDGVINIPANSGVGTDTSLLLPFNNMNASLGGFSFVGSDTFRWDAARSAVFVAKFVGRVINATSPATTTRVAVQIYAGASGSPALVSRATGSVLVSATPDTTVEGNLVLQSERFSLNSGQVIQVRATRNNSAGGTVSFDSAAIQCASIPSVITFDTPSYTLFVQEVSG